MFPLFPFSCNCWQWVTMTKRCLDNSYISKGWLTLFPSYSHWLLLWVMMLHRALEHHGRFHRRGKVLFQNKTSERRKGSTERENDKPVFIRSVYTGFDCIFESGLLQRETFVGKMTDVNQREREQMQRSGEHSLGEVLELKKIKIKIMSVSSKGNPWCCQFWLYIKIIKRIFARNN